MGEDRKERFRRIFEEHSGAVYNYALRRVSSRDEAKDIVADCFLAAWRRLDDVPERPLPWLLGTARKALANQRRGARNRDHLVLRLGDELAADGRPALVSEPALWGAADPAPAAEDDDSLRLRAALLRLPESHREALELVYWEGLSTAEAARAAGCTRPAMLVRLHRGRKRLEGELAIGGDAFRVEATAGVGDS
jgi:RNA polymerase sigma factor (sigma-70 family)